MAEKVDWDAETIPHDVQVAPQEIVEAMPPVVEPKKWYQKPVVWVIIVIVSLLVLCSMITVCGVIFSLGSAKSSINTQEKTISKPVEPSKDSTEEPSADSDRSSATESKNGSTSSAAGYQKIYDKYAKMIKDAAPSSSITELSKITDEGMAEMAKYMLQASGTDGQYETYEKWAGKLMDVYMSEAR